VGFNQQVKPFLKWAGGKRQLLPQLQNHLPKPNTYLKYYEPFVGGGALLFTLQPTLATINDSNSELINCYEVIRDSPQELIDALMWHQSRYSSDYYYKIRAWDRDRHYPDKFTPVERAARIVFLNKTCYNGLFRVNSKGFFNVPCGRYKTLNIFDESVLYSISEYLRNNIIEILNTDFETAIEQACSKDFIYFDPPYDPVSTTASFTGYQRQGFDRDEQIRLKNVVDRLGERGCKVLLSNAFTDFIWNLYDGYHRFKIPATRAINSNAQKRGKIYEVLIKNYE
jgi:DNA adenine methylase